MKSRENATQQALLCRDTLPALAHPQTRVQGHVLTSESIIKSSGCSAKVTIRGMLMRIRRALQISSSQVRFVCRLIRWRNYSNQCTRYQSWTSTLNNTFNMNVKNSCPQQIKSSSYLTTRYNASTSTTSWLITMNAWGLCDCMKGWLER